LPSQVKIWTVLSLIVSTGILFGAIFVKTAGNTPAYMMPGLHIAAWEAVALLLCGILFTALVRRFGPALEKAESTLSSVANTDAYARRPYVTLFIVSFVVLFVELMLIRYCGSQMRVFSFYKNVPLIACFLGLGLGCFLSGGTPRNAFTFLLWLTPLSVFLSAGSIVMSSVLGKHAAIGSTEHILGDLVLSAERTAGQVLFSQAIMAAFCVITLVVITLLFAQLGRLMGAAFDQVARLPGYTINILGSLAGILGFTGLSYLETPPWVWFAVGLAPLLWWIVRRFWRPAALGLILLNCAAVFPGYGETVWSCYQKLVGHPVSVPGENREEENAYLLEISDVFYQVAADLTTTRVSQLKIYDAVYEGIPRPERVVIVGSGMGNDVAAALHAGADRVDAVDIDPAIIEIGRRNHPEKPYADPRVRVTVDDARHAFRYLPRGSYDVVVFGLLDSHTQLGMSSVRLDNYVFTMESLAEAKQLLKPGGRLIILAATYRAWFRDRFEKMMQATFEGPVKVARHGVWETFVGVAEKEPQPLHPATPALDSDVPTDNWPYLYLPRRGVPRAYLPVVACLAIASVVVLKVCGMPFGRFSGYHGHLFFLGSAFLLMEVNAINRLALLFGTTWIVSAVTIAIVLFLIVCANLTVMALGRVPYWLAYTLLGVSLGLSWWLQPGMILGKGIGMALIFGLLILSPVYFAGLVFARSFSMAEAAAPAIGANILGSVLGGWIEYGTMAFGMHALVLLAGGFYLLSLLLLMLTQKS